VFSLDILSHRMSDMAWIQQLTQMQLMQRGFLMITLGLQMAVGGNLVRNVSLPYYHKLASVTRCESLKNGENLKL
jgi:hypothetical protein